jgi:type II secretory pathway component PulF
LKKEPIKNIRRSSVLFLGGEKDYFADNLAMLLSAGISISSAITIMGEASYGKRYKRVLSEVSNELDEGIPLWKTLSGRGILNDSYIYMIKVGEASGRLPENLGIVSEQERKNKSFNSKLASALIYPGIILSLTLIIGIGVTTFIIPNMAKVFNDMRINLPLPTKVMIAIGGFINKNPILFASMVIGLITIILLVFFIPGTKKIGQAILFRTPRIKDLYKEVEVARFGYIMFSLSQAGVPLTEALSSIEHSTNLAPYRKFYHYLYLNINDGISLEKSFLKYKNLRRILPVNVQQMIIAGEHSGNFVSILGRISGIYEEKIDTTSKNLSVVLEPILLVVVALGVLFLALAVIMPIYGLVGGLNAQ